MIPQTLPMNDDPARQVQPNERQDVKKRGAGSAGGGPMRGTLRLTVRALGELLGGVAAASAEAFRSFNEKLAAGEGEGAAGASALGADFVDGVAEGNARFLEGIAAASRKAYENFKASHGPASVPEAIDYERLARHVAVELKKADPKV